MSDEVLRHVRACISQQRAHIAASQRNLDEQLENLNALERQLFPPLANDAKKRFKEEQQSAAFESAVNSEACAKLLERLMRIPKSELNTIWMHAQCELEKSPHLGFEWQEIDAATTSTAAVNKFQNAVFHHPHRHVIYNAVHQIALKYSPSFVARCAAAT